MLKPKNFVIFCMHFISDRFNKKIKHKSNYYIITNNNIYDEMINYYWHT